MPKFTVKAVSFAADLDASYRETLEKYETAQRELQAAESAETQAWEALVAAKRSIAR